MKKHEAIAALKAAGLDAHFDCGRVWFEGGCIATDYRAEVKADDVAFWVARAAAAAMMAAQNAQFMAACQMKASGRCEGCGQ